jgi:hypothetical protein
MIRLEIKDNVVQALPPVVYHSARPICKIVLYTHQHISAQKVVSYERCTHVYNPPWQCFIDYYIMVCLHVITTFKASLYWPVLSMFLYEQVFTFCFKVVPSVFLLERLVAQYPPWNLLWPTSFLSCYKYFCCSCFIFCDVGKPWKTGVVSPYMHTKLSWVNSHVLKSEDSMSCLVCLTY